MFKTISVRTSRVIITTLLLLIIGCGKSYTPEQERYIHEIEKHRYEKNLTMKNSPTSPFNARTKVEFSDLKYFDVDPDFIFQTKLIEYNSKDTIEIYGTKGEPRTTIRFGYLPFRYKDIEYRVNIYKFFLDKDEAYFSIWFTDKTTGKETYGVGRYINFDYNPNKDYIYTLDFNLAYNPYCAYSSDYSCAIPTDEDYIDLEIKAGEKTFH